MLDKRVFCFVHLCVVNVNCSIKQSSRMLIVAKNVVAQRQKTKAVLKSTAELYGVYGNVEMYQKEI